jgi:hypothetical protein
MGASYRYACFRAHAGRAAPRSTAHDVRLSRSRGPRWTSHDELEDAVITLCYVDGDEDLLIQSVVTAAIACLDGLEGQGESLKWRQLGRLGIEPQDDERPIDAWLRAMAEANGLPHTTPTHAALTSAILQDRGAARFLFWLA